MNLLLAVARMELSSSSFMLGWAGRGSDSWLSVPWAGLWKAPHQTLLAAGMGCSVDDASGLAGPSEPVLWIFGEELGVWAGLGWVGQGVGLGRCPAGLSWSLFWAERTSGLDQEVFLR